MNRPHLRALCIFGGAAAISYWKILLTCQFSLLMGSEAAIQAYLWYHFIASCIKQDHWPTWAPYTFSGRTTPIS